MRSQVRQDFVLAHGAEAELLPGRLRAFDDEGRGVGIELVGVRPDPAVLGLLEDEGEGVVEFLLGAEPDEFVLAQIDGGLEIFGEFLARPRIQSVGRNDEVVILRQRRGAGDLGLEDEVDAKLARAVLQQHEQLLARDAGEAVAARHDPLAAIVDRDVVPIGEVGADRLGAGRIVGGDVVEGLVGKHHAPAERVVGPVAFEHGDVVRAVAQLHADREIEPGRAAAEASNLHRYDLLDANPVRAAPLLFAQAQDGMLRQLFQA